MKRHSFSTSAFIVTALALFALVTPAVARADHSWYAGAGAGFINDFDCCRVHGRVQGEIGWHFSGNDTGFFLEADAIGTFGNDYWMFTGGVRLGGDIEVHHDAHFHLLLRPSGLLGLGARDYSGDGRYGPIGNVTIAPAFDLRFILADGLIALWVRPVSFDFMIWWDHNSPANGNDVSVLYQLLGGVDFQF
jgi:hypothetical protein